jgi:hypothetical protein
VQRKSGYNADLPRYSPSSTPSSSEEKPMTNTLIRPKTPTTIALASVGVELIHSRGSAVLKCRVCGHVWSPQTQPGGRLPRP